MSVRRASGALLGLIALSCALGLALSCGGKNGEPIGPVEAFGGGPMAEGTESDTCLMILLDGVRASELAIPDLSQRYPALASLRASSTDHGPAMAASTGGNASLASAMTGLHPREHGVQSMHHIGRARLDGRLQTIPQAFQEAGWATVAALPSPRHARGLGGFARGFDVFAAPQVAEPERSADLVVASVIQDVRARLEGDAPVFAALVFSDGMARTAPLGDPRTAGIVRRWMEPLAQEHGRVAVALDELSKDQAKGIRAFTQLYGRSLSGRPAAAWRGALAEVRIAAIDSAIGELLAAIESAGRAERTTVILGGLRGRAARGSTSGPALSKDAIEVPFWVRSSAHPNVALALSAKDRPPSVLDYSRVMVSGFFEGWPALQGPPLASHSIAGAEHHALMASVDGSLHGARGRRLHVERYADGQLVAFRGGEPVELDEEMRHGVEPLLTDFATPAALEVLGAQAGIELRWQLSNGARVPRPDAGRRPMTRGGLDALDRGRGGLRVLPIAERTAVIRCGVRGDGVGPRSLALGDMIANQLPVMYLPAEGAPTVQEGQESETVPRLRFSHCGGVDWSLTLSAEGLKDGARAEVLLTLWPPLDPSDLLEVPVSNVALTHVEGRRDLVHLEGQLPFDVLLKRTGKERFAVACAIDGVFLGPDQMASGTELYAGPDRFDVVLPAWQPGVSDVMTDLTEILYNQGSDAPLAPLALRRRGFGPIPNAASALPFDALEFVGTLPSYE